MNRASPASSHTTTLGGLKARYLQWGTDHTPAVLMLHGLRSYACTWAPIAEALCSRYFIIAPDFRGRGDSQWDPERNYYTSFYVSDVEELVAELGLSRFTIIGHSMGGTVAYAYAARHPEQVTRLIIEDIGPGSSTVTAGADRIVREMRSAPSGFDSTDAAQRYWRGIRPGISEAALKSRMTNTLRPGTDGRWEWKLDMAGIAEARLSDNPAGQVDIWKCVEELRCPALVVRGAQSDFLPAATCEEMSARQPRLTWAEIPDAGHYVHDDNPSAYLQAVRDFLRETR